jgi:hypothetical protein
MTGVRIAARFAARFVARIIVVSLVCAVATMLFGWMSVPIVGFVFGFVCGVSDRHASARGTVTALGGALGWLAILCTEAARGADIRLVAERVGDVMQLPAFAFVLITLAFAALLSGTSAVLGREIGLLIPDRARRV